MKKKIVILLLSLLVFSVENIYSQEDSLKYPFWLNASIGGYPEYIGAGVSFNKALKDFSYQVSLNTGAKLDEFLSKYRYVTTGVAGLGITHVKPSIIASVYGGPSVSYGEAGRNNYFWGAGLGLNAQIYFMPLYKLFPGLGIGLEFYYNYNFMQTRANDYRHVYLLRLGGMITNLHD
ncbi:MAG: hypothetical protein R6W90_10525 [Ignavibacteriaceae bacterium]